MSNRWQSDLARSFAWLTIFIMSFNWKREREKKNGLSHVKFICIDAVMSIQLNQTCPILLTIAIISILSSIQFRIQCVQWQNTTDWTFWNSSLRPNENRSIEINSNNLVHDFHIHSLSMGMGNFVCARDGKNQWTWTRHEFYSQHTKCQLHVLISPYGFDFPLDKYGNG